MPGCLLVYTVLFELPDQIATHNFFFYSNLHIFYNLKNDHRQLQSIKLMSGERVLFYAVQLFKTKPSLRKAREVRTAELTSLCELPRNVTEQLLQSIFIFPRFFSFLLISCKAFLKRLLDTGKMLHRDPWDLSISLLYLLFSVSSLIIIPSKPGWKMCLGFKIYEQKINML